MFGFDFTWRVAPEAKDVLFAILGLAVYLGTLLSLVVWRVTNVILAVLLGLGVIALGYYTFERLVPPVAWSTEILRVLLVLCAIIFGIRVGSKLT